VIARLRAFAYPRDEERCELCGAAIGDAHDHLVREGKLQCACGPCAVLFDGRGRVRPKAERADSLSDEEWARLGIPVRLAYFVRSGDGIVAYFPSAAGAIASPVDDLQLDLEPEIEALLVDRGRGAWRVSIDHCHRLTGLLRRGGKLEDFFACLS
jgi:hypothetical protein